MRRAIVIGTVLWAASARADSLALAIDGCESAAEIRRAVDVELGGFGHGTRASVACDGAVAILRAGDPGRSLSRTIELGPDPARLIALALVELIAATEHEDAFAPPSSVPRRFAVAPPPTVRATVAGGAMKFSADSRMLAGGGIRIADRGARAGWMLDAQVHRGSEAMTLGVVSTDVLAIGAAAQLHIGRGRAYADLGAGIRGGGVRMTGIASSPATRAGSFWSRWYGPLVRGDLAVRITECCALAGAVEAGFVASPVTGLVDGRSEAAVDGSWVQLQFGIQVLL